MGSDCGLILGYPGINLPQTSCEGRQVNEKCIRARSMLWYKWTRKRLRSGMAFRRRWYSTWVLRDLCNRSWPKHKTCVFQQFWQDSFALRWSSQEFPLGSWSYLPRQSHPITAIWYRERTWSRKRLLSPDEWITENYGGHHQCKPEESGASHRLHKKV